MVQLFRVALLVPCLTISPATAGAPQASQTAAAQAGPRALRVMTYNIKHGQTNTLCIQPAALPGQPPSPDCNLDLQASIAVIRSHAPDIVGVQEVDRFWARSGGKDEPALLSAGLGMPHSCYGANLDHQPDAHAAVPHQYGTVILSRFPILECTNTLLPKTGTNEQRGLTLAVIDVGGAALHFYNTHLHTTAAERLLQTAQIASIVDASPAGPRLMVGDFNARPGAAELVPIQERFVDAWQKVGAARPDNPAGYTSPAELAGSPTSRIDYVFADPKIDLQSAVVPLDAATRVASDHYPVVVAMTLPGSDAGVRRGVARRKGQ